MERHRTTGEERDNDNNTNNTNNLAAARAAARSQPGVPALTGAEAGERSDPDVPRELFHTAGERRTAPSAAAPRRTGLGGTRRGAGSGSRSLSPAKRGPSCPSAANRSPPAPWSSESKEREGLKGGRKESERPGTGRRRWKPEEAPRPPRRRQGRLGTAACPRRPPAGKGVSPLPATAGAAGRGGRGAPLPCPAWLRGAVQGGAGS